MENQVLYSCGYEITNEGWAETYEEQIPAIVFFEHKVLSETDRCFRVTSTEWSVKERKSVDKIVLVLKDQSGKRFAYTTKERALEAFIIKRKSYGRRLRAYIENNDRLIELAKNLTLHA